MPSEQSYLNKISSERIRYNILRRSTRSKFTPQRYPLSQNIRPLSCKNCSSKNDSIRNLFNYVEFLEQSNISLLRRFNDNSVSNIRLNSSSEYDTPRAFIDLVPSIVKDPPFSYPPCQVSGDEYYSSSSDSSSSVDSSATIISSSHSSPFNWSPMLSSFQVNISNSPISSGFTPPSNFYVHFAHPEDGSSNRDS